MAASSSVGLTAWWINPQSAASTALTFSPSSSIRLALARPTSRGSSQVAPESGTEAPLDEGLPEHRVGGGEGEVGCQREVAAEPRRPSPHATEHGQLDGRDELDRPMSGMGDPPHQIAGAGPLPAVGGDPIHAGAEVVAAPDVNGAQGIVGGGLGQCLD